MRLNSVDLPTLGRPTMATMGRGIRQLDGFWLPHPQDERRGGAKRGAEAEGGLRTGESPERPCNHAGGEIRCAVDSVEEPERGAQPASLDQRACERALDGAHHGVLGPHEQREEAE